MSENDGGSFFLGFLIGAMAGAAAALLLTPQSGEDLRRTIEQRSVELKDEAARRAEEAKTQAQKLADDAKLGAQRLADDAKSQAQRLATDAKGQVEYVQEKGRIVLSEKVGRSQPNEITAQDTTPASDEPPFTGTL